MAYDTILVDTVDSVRVLTMNRPERLNAWTPKMGAELSEAIQLANEDDDVIAMVLTGEGRGFCAGADIEAVFKAQADGKDTGNSGGTRDWVNQIRESKPMVAAINGAAVGVGLTQVLPMDYLIASDQAKLSMRFVKMGLVPELASSHFLASRLGFGNASELMLSGKTIMANEAKEIGLVDRVTSKEELVPVAIEVARGMGDNPLASVRHIKKLLTANANDSDL